MVYFRFTFSYISEEITEIDTHTSLHAKLASQADTGVSFLSPLAGRCKYIDFYALVRHNANFVLKS